MRRQDECEIDIMMREEWTCSFLAWLPEECRTSQQSLRRIVREGIEARCVGALRERIAGLADAGRIEVLPLGPARGRIEPRWVEVARLRGEVGPMDGSLVEVSATGALDAGVTPLWASLLGARSLASALGGRVADPAWPRVMGAGHDDDVLPEAPPVVIGELLLVLSGADPSGQHAHLVTLGLSRFGLPELEAGEVPEAAMPGLGRVATAIAGEMLLRAIAAPASERGVRRLRLPREMEVTRAMVDRAFGATPRQALSGAPVGLQQQRLPDGESVLRLGPPADSMMPRHLWARALAHVVGAPWRAPPRL